MYPQQGRWQPDLPPARRLSRDRENLRASWRVRACVLVGDLNQLPATLLGEHGQVLMYYSLIRKLSKPLESTRRDNLETPP